MRSGRKRSSLRFSLVVNLNYVLPSISLSLFDSQGVQSYCCQTAHRVVHSIVNRCKGGLRTRLLSDFPVPTFLEGLTAAEFKQSDSVRTPTANSVRWIPRQSEQKAAVLMLIFNFETQLLESTKLINKTFSLPLERES